MYPMRKENYHLQSSKNLFWKVCKILVKFKKDEHKLERVQKENKWEKAQSNG